MKEIKSIINAYAGIDLEASHAALATIVNIEGSSYRRLGARMLVMENGTYLGGISGGCLEGDALRKAQHAIVSNRSSIVRYDTTQDDDHQVGVGLGCNGIIDVLFTPLHANDKNNPVILLSQVTDTREPVVLVTISGYHGKNNYLSHAIIFRDDVQFLNNFPIKEIGAQVMEDAQLLLHNQHSGSKTYLTHEGEITVFIEVIKPETRIILYGSNYDLFPLMRISKELGWQVFVVTNINKAQKTIFELADKVIDHKIPIGNAIDRFSAILLMSHDYQTDFNNLQQVLASQSSYIGLLGPAKRSNKMLEYLEMTGNPVTATEKERIYSPAGLDIGAATPEEIALSITAEIQSHFTGSQGISLRTKKGTIHNH